jgi:hypothetical protein
MQDMDGYTVPAGDPKRSASNLMFYTAIVGKSPTIDRPSAPTPPARGSLRWFTSHCRHAGYAMGGSLRHVWGRATKVVAERSHHGDVKRVSQAH